MTIQEFHASLNNDEQLELESLRHIRSAEDIDTDQTSWDVWY